MGKCLSISYFSFYLIYDQRINTHCFSNFVKFICLQAVESIMSLVAVGVWANSNEAEQGLIRPGCIEQTAVQTPKGKRELRKGESEERCV